MSIRRIVVGLVLLVSALCASGCASFAVDGTLKDVPPAAYTKPASPKPVQLLFSFQSQGSPNARATDFLKSEVSSTALASGLFASVSEMPVPNGALLTVTINNLPISDDAFAKGFATGFTFGLVGNTVTDGYLCTVEYISAEGVSKISKVSRHAIHTTMGAKGSPDNAVPTKNADEAVRMMARQIFGNALKEVSTDPAFAR